MSNGGCFVNCSIEYNNDLHASVYVKNQQYLIDIAIESGCQETMEFVRNINKQIFPEKRGSRVYTLLANFFRR